MAQAGDGAITRNRAEMAAIGAVAGLALWLFVDVLPDALDDRRLLLVLATLILGGFGVVLALGGPERIGRAALGALSVAVPAAGLIWLASLRYPVAPDLMQYGHGAVALGAILFLATPFAAAGCTEPGGWRRYPLLFDAAWMIVVRFIAAIFFTGVFWAVLMLSDQLLQLVGITIIDDFIDLDPVPYVLSGLLLGLAIQVVHEMRAYVSPFVIHRLLRLLLPALLPVVALFLAAIPFRGLGGLFGGLSPAATLMGVALAAVTLISTATDRDDASAAQSGVVRDAGRLMALMLPVLAGLAVYAVWRRVDQYGWTPDRLLAGLAAVFLLAYGLAYAGAVLRGAGWMVRIRTANRWMAMAVVAVAGLWLTPVIDATRISAQSQLARIESGAHEPQEMALWELAQRWGHAGQAALERVEARAETAGDATLARAVERARTTRSRYGFEQATGETGTDAMAEAVSAVLVRMPGARSVPVEALDRVPGFLLSEWERACAMVLGDGRPGCVAVTGPFRPGVEEEHGFILLHMGGDRLQVQGIVLRDGALSRMGGAHDMSGRVDPGTPLTGSAEALIGAALDGRFEVVPAGVNALRIGDVELIPDN
ncbi:DUF4153 domain-containing protein [Aquicoccus porphyridii]|uniref:DUF4153 domain-containing protein n=1 Tax=Aquicoccus porphyridii TaxID=1852029 RepID=UPI00273CFBBC|nr:DUF4153 domain-containing protein [Aquicoccus porphyridii]